MSGGAVAAPTTVEEVEELVKRLYAPGPPTLITAIDKQLKELQQSEFGWKIADTLLGSRDANVRFFGALTFQVKLNNEGPRLDLDAARDVLLRLLSWTVHIDRTGDVQVVRRKLCATLGTYFVRSPALWTRPILQLAASYQHNSAVPGSELSPPNDALHDFLQDRTESQLTTLLWLSGTIATEAAKLENNGPDRGVLHKQMEQIEIDACALIHDALQRAFVLRSTRIKAEVLSCFLHWVNYAQYEWSSNTEALNNLRHSLPELALLLADNELHADALDVFRDILENYQSFIPPTHMVTLARIINDYVSSRLQQGLRDNEPEVLPVAQFVCAYGIANVDHIVRYPEDELRSGSIVNLCLGILDAPGSPGDDDEVSIHCLEFWNTYVEHVADTLHSESEEPLQPVWLGNAKDVCLRLATLLWAKSRLPPPGTLQDWTDAESDAFKEFRTDASELLTSTFLLLGKTLMEQLVGLTLRALEARNWQDLEAGLFCINTLADSVPEDQTAQDVLSQVFGSTLFREIMDFNQHIPSQTRRTAIDLLGCYGAYIEKHVQYLPDSLRFLFACLAHNGLSGVAAKSVASLCAACRASLTGELDGFLAQFHEFVNSTASEPYTIQKVLSAIGAIIQAVTPESAKASPLSTLLDHVDRTIERAEHLAHSSDFDGAHTTGVSALDYLSSIGKSLQVPDDKPIVLDDSQESSTPEGNYWNSQEGQRIQARIYTSCYTVLQLLPLSGEAVEGVCQVFKSGFSETEPGPFVFSPEPTIALLEQCTSTTPQLEAVLSTASTLLVQYSRGEARRIDDEAHRIYVMVASFLQVLVEPNRDPGVAQSCLDVLNGMTSRYLNIILDVSAAGDLVKPILDFSIKAVDGIDLMPRRAAANLWVSLIMATPEDEAVQGRMAQVMAAYGPILTQALINQISGAGLRTEMAQICEPLRCLLQMQSHARDWLHTALSTDPIATRIAHVGDTDRSRFVQSVWVLRNDTRRLREVVVKFYAVCRGTLASYR